MSGTQAHWNHVYDEREPDEVSWFEPTPATSLALIDELGLEDDAPILDAGGGASGLARELLGRGHSDVTVADISRAALDRARAELGAEAGRVRWEVADLRDHEFGRRFALWHDRAMFHFMVAPADRAAYVKTLVRSVAPTGHALIATFGPDGPTRCSGLPAARYGAEELEAAFAGRCKLVTSRLIEHRTPAGRPQQFLYALLRPSPEA